MNGPNYYNEHDPKAASWLRELIAQKLIPDGTVDTRSIVEVQPADLDGFTQCHFFAGIGGWPLALHLAGYPTTRPVWTGSCPCQPFSAAGLKLGELDERHLWPAFYRLISQCRPPVVFGEQVASKAALQWLDGVFADLESSDYACGAADMCAAGTGAPHIRQRLFWVADAAGGQREQGLQPIPRGQSERAGGGSQPCGMGNTDEQGREEHGRSGELHLRESDRKDSGRLNIHSSVSSHWIDFDILPCRDGKARRVESGTFPLVNGIPGDVVPGSDPSVSEAQATAEARVMRLKGYGNAIVPQLAAEFIKAFLET